MAPKKPTVFEQRADSSSDDEEQVSHEEEEEVSSEEEEEVSSEEEDPKTEEEDGSDSGSDEEVTPVAPVKPVGAKSKQKQPAPATAPASAVTVGKKRLVESSMADGKVSKKLKMVDREDKRVAEEEEMKKVGEEPKKQLFLRVFSEADEIVMLNALLDYSEKEKKCIDPVEDFNYFHDIVKKSIHVDVTSTQLADKINRLKRKYKKNASKTKQGVDKRFTKGHDQLCYDLSKKIWGKAASASGGSELKESNGKGKRTTKPNMKHDIPPQVVKEEAVRENNFTLSELGMTELSDDILKKGFELLSDEARAALEKKWKNIATAELELYHKRLELSRETVKLTLDALKAASRH